MTDLLERYLAAIARNLPDAQRRDVTAELGDLLLSEIEEEEGRLGRPQTREELEALLIRFGHPLTVSGRYRKVQHLIGPEIFPFWWAAVKVSLAVVIGIYVVLVAIGMMATGAVADDIAESAPGLVPALLATVGGLTLAFAAIEQFGPRGRRIPWKPRQLPPARGGSPPTFELVVEIGMGAVALLWWIGLIHFPNTIPQIGLRVDLAPVWRAWFWPITIYIGFEMGVNLFALFQPGRFRTVGLLSITRNLAGAAILSAIYQAGHWLEVSLTVLDPPALAEAQARFDTGMRIGIGCTILVFLVIAAVSAWRLRRQLADAASLPAAAA